jgi:hypothetical protein
MKSSVISDTGLRLVGPPSGITAFNVVANGTGLAPTREPMRALDNGHVLVCSMRDLTKLIAS